MRNLVTRPDQVKAGSPLALRLQELRQSKSDVIELGGGTGLAGLQLASTPVKGQVLITDLPSALDILHRNVSTLQHDNRTSIEASSLDWTEELPSKIAQRRFGLILVSDCTYNTDSIPSLVKTINDLMDQSPQASTVIATKVRHGSESMFRRMLAECNIAEVEHLTFALPDLQREFYGQEPEVVDVYTYQKS